MQKINKSLLKIKVQENIKKNFIITKNQKVNKKLVIKI